MKKPVHYRPLSERGDMNELIRLIRTELIPLSYSTNPSDQSVIRTLPDRFREGRTIVAAKSKKSGPLGFIHYQFIHSLMHIDMLVVHPDHRSSGIGRELMKRAETSAKEQRCLLSMLYVDDVNDKARRFYTSIGYVPTRYVEEYKITQLTKSL